MLHVHHDWHRPRAHRDTRHAGLQVLWHNVIRMLFANTCGSAGGHEFEMTSACYIKPKTIAITCSACKAC